MWAEANKETVVRLRGNPPTKHLARVIMYLIPKPWNHNRIHWTSTVDVSEQTVPVLAGLDDFKAYTEVICMVRVPVLGLVWLKRAGWQRYRTLQTARLPRGN